MDDLRLRRVWRLTKRGVAIGGTRRHGGWVVSAWLTVDLGQLTIGVNWQTDDFEDPDPLLSVHLPGAYVWFRFYRILPGFRAKRRARRERGKRG